MKFGTYFAYWEQEWQADYSFYCRKAAELGFDILEIAAGSLPNMSDKQLFDLSQTAKASQITLTSCIGLPAQYNVASEDAVTRRNGIEYVKQLMVHMDKIDSRLLGGIIYAYWPCDFNQPFNKEICWENSILSMQELAQTAKDFGILLTIEVVNRFEQFLINDAQEAVKFINEVGNDSVKVMLDCFHMNIEEDHIGDAIRATGANLAHYHIGEANRKVPGKGHMPWSEIGQALRDINYHGGVVMEPFVRMGGTVGHDIKVFRDLSEKADDATLDEEIRAALKYVKGEFLGH